MALNQAGPVFRPEPCYPYTHHVYTDIEKRQLFLRSYQFSTNKNNTNTTVSTRMKRSFFRVRRVIWVRIRSVKKFRKTLWFRIKHGLVFSFRKKRFFRILHSNINPSSGLRNTKPVTSSWSPSSIFW